MKSLICLAVAFLFLATLPLAAQTGTWTAVASTGTLDESAAGAYSLSGPNLSHVAGSLTTLVARYNVTNTYGGGSDDTPLWTRFELGSLDTAPAGTVTARLYRVEPCTGNQVLICTATSVDNTAPDCETCTITAGFDFSQYLYYVEVTVSRTSSLVTPTAKTLRIY